MEKEFKNLKDIIADEHFKSFVRKELNELKDKRIGRPQAKAGYRYKRDWFDRMIESNSLSTNYFLTHIESIWEKKSSLSSEFRSIIKWVCNRAYYSTIKEYGGLIEEEAA